MPVTPFQYVEAPAVSPLPFGLLDVASVVPGDAHSGVAGVTYEPEFCGPSFSTVGQCEDWAVAGTISISVSNTRVATITGTGEASGTGYYIDWGSAQFDNDVSLDGQTNTYAAAGTYTVHVTRPATGYRATVVITVNNASTSGPFAATAEFVKIDSDGIPVIEGAPFAVYHMQRCRTIGSYSDAQARARRSLELGEGRAVEAVMEARFAADTVDITPVAGTPIDIVNGLGMLEGYAASFYGGVSTIHMPRRIATMLASRGSVLRIGDHLETVLGSKVVAGAGYAGAGITGLAADAGAVFMFVTGTVLLRQGTIIESGPQMMFPKNEYRALAERPYVGSWECICAAVQVNASSCCP